MDIVKYGKFYYPASTHYGSLTANVTCDRCQRSSLTCCVGYADSDLCMGCVEIVVQTQTDTQTSQPSKREFGPDVRYRTMMLQDQTQPWSSQPQSFQPPQPQQPPYPFQPPQPFQPRTRMLQNIFKTKKSQP